MEEREKVLNLFSACETKAERCKAKVTIRVQSELLDELIWRLGQLQVKYRTCLQLNDRCLEADHLQVHFDPLTGTVHRVVEGKSQPLFQLKSNDPSMPVEIKGLVKNNFFVPGQETSGTKNNPELVRVENDLSSALEDFYYSASKIWDLVEQKILAKRKSKFVSVKMVRNRLIEHTHAGFLNSFGASSSVGPRVKPSRNSLDSEEHSDCGLIPKTNELLEYVLTRLDYVRATG